jgi:hypothetical protein
MPVRRLRLAEATRRFHANAAKLAAARVFGVRWGEHGTDVNIIHRAGNPDD